MGCHALLQKRHRCQDKYKWQDKRLTGGTGLCQLSYEMHWVRERYAEYWRQDPKVCLRILQTFWPFCPHLALRSLSPYVLRPPWEMEALSLTGILSALLAQELSQVSSFRFSPPWAWYPWEGHQNLLSVISQSRWEAVRLTQVLICSWGFSLSSDLNLFLCICLLHFQVFFWIHDTAPRLIIIARSFQRLCELPERTV